MKDSDKIRNLVFQGGSVKGIAYAGVLLALQNFLDLRNIKRIAGTSAGSIIAVVLAMGCDAREARDLIFDFDFRMVLDDRGFKTAHKLLKTADKLDNKPVFLAKIPAETKLPVMVSRIMNQFGIYEGEYFRRWAEDFVTRKAGRAFLTFGELHILVESKPDVYKDLYVVGVNLSTGLSQVFSYEETPDVIISDAVRISMSIPMIFKPHTLHYKDAAGDRVPDPKQHIWVDGGLFDNYPIRVFDYTRYLAASSSVSDESLFNKETLGFRLIARDKKDFFEGLTDAPEMELTNIIAFVKALAKSALNKQNSDHAQSEDPQRSIYIDTLGVGTLAFNISEQQQENLVLSGRASVEKYFRGATDIDVTALSSEPRKEDHPATSPPPESKCCVS